MKTCIQVSLKAITSELYQLRTMVAGTFGHQNLKYGTLPNSWNVQKIFCARAPTWKGREREMYINDTAVVMFTNSQLCTSKLQKMLCFLGNLTYVDLNFRPICQLRISGPAQGGWYCGKGWCMAETVHRVHSQYITKQRC